MTHTPGLWKVSARFPTKVHDSFGLIVARAFDEGGRGETAVANARLIAAAPELLDALRAALALIDNLTEQDDRLGATDAACDHLRAAIQKATEEVQT